MFRICVYLLCCFRFIALGGRLCGSAGRQHATRRRDLPTSAPSLRLSAFIPSKLNEQTRAHNFPHVLFVHFFFFLLISCPPHHHHHLSLFPELRLFSMQYRPRGRGEGSWEWIGGGEGRGAVGTISSDWCFPHLDPSVLASFSASFLYFSNFVKRTKKKYEGGEGAQVWHPLCAQMSPLKEFSVISKFFFFFFGAARRKDGCHPWNHGVFWAEGVAVDYLSQPIVKFTQNKHAGRRMQE